MRTVFYYSPNSILSIFYYSPNAANSVFGQMPSYNFPIPGHAQTIFKTQKYVWKQSVKEQSSAFKMYTLISVWYSK